MSQQSTAPEAHHTHFVGIGGVGMSGLALLLRTRGERVSGCDLHDSETLADLRHAGAAICVGHGATHLDDGVTRLVYSAAVPAGNPERVAAAKRGIESLSRAQLLAEVIGKRTCVAIAGTHGKTTTTAMLAAICLAGGADPSVLIGGRWAPIGGTVRIGGGQHFIVEACEAYESFLELRPHLAAITNIEADHLDYYGDLRGVVEGFRRFLARLDAGGALIASADCPNTLALARETSRRVVLTGLSAEAALRGEQYRLERGGSHLDLAWRGDRLGELRLGVAGEHNARNALTAVAAALELGLPFSAAQAALAGFTGVERRQETLGEAREILVMDDYAHHPTEIRATLAALRQSRGRRMVAVFQPHLYSRTQEHLAEFADSFHDAGAVVITDIYAAREQPIAGVTAARLAEGIAARSPKLEVRYVGDRDAAPACLREITRAGDLVVTLGAGDIRQAGERFLAWLRDDCEEGA